MIELRIYRAAFFPALLAVAVVMFSLEDRPEPLPQGLPADVLFDEEVATAQAERLAQRQPDRRAGTRGDAVAAREVRDALARSGFETQVDRFDERGTELINVVARRIGASRRQVVVLAGRDAVDVPDVAGSAADTAALLEVGRALGNRPSRRTLVLASVDGTALGDAGARRLAATVVDRERIDVVIALSNLGAPGTGEAEIVPWSNDPSRENVGLARTVTAALRQELGSATPGAGTLGQFVRLAFPIGLGAQGVLLERDIEAIRLSGSGELPPEDASAPIDEERFGGLGRSAVRTVAALDRGGSPERGPEAYLSVARKLMPRWALAVLTLCLLLPACAAAVDAVARARRRRLPVGRSFQWLLAGVVPFVAGLVVAELLVLAGQAPHAPSAPLVPGAEPLDAGAGAALGLTVVSAALAWVAGRALVSRRVAPAARAPGRGGGPPVTDFPGPAGGAALALAFGFATLLVWFYNPYAALLLVPAVHLWMLAATAEVATRRWVGAALVAGGLVLPLLAGGYYLSQLSLGPVEGLWYLFLLVTGGQVGLPGALWGCLVLGTLASVASLVAARRPLVREEAATSVRGPATHLGPGSLGGTIGARR